MAGTTLFMILFMVLTIVLLAMTTWYLYLRNQVIGCDIDPNVWCFNDWTCSVPIGASPSVCFVNGGVTNDLGDTVNPPGLYNCLLGPESRSSTLCNKPCPNPASCPSCACEINTLKNCYNGCPLNLTELHQRHPDTTCAVKT